MHSCECYFDFIHLKCCCRPDKITSPWQHHFPVAATTEGGGLSELPELESSVESWEQGTEHCALQSANTKVLTSIWVVLGPLCLQGLCGFMDGQFRGVWKSRSWSPCSNGSHTYLIDISEFLLTTACPHLPTPYLEFLRAQSLVQRCILYICYLWVI